MKQFFLVLAGLTGTLAAAHHSPAIFDQDREIDLEGIVSRYDWKYPHVYIFVDVEDDNGQLVRWQIEGDDPRTMMGGGWTATSLSTGDRVALRAHPDRNSERHHALMLSLSTPDGETLVPERLDGAEPTIPAADIFSLWDPSRLDEASLDSGLPTEKGTAAQAAYNEEDSPESQCMPPAPPISIGSGLTRISMQGGNILLQTEEFQVERIVYMDGEHPANGERTIQGHSIGWWEGDVLVVDTMLFTAYINGSLFGIPSGAQKHLVERFSLINGRTQLRFDFVLEDPEYLQEPATGGINLDHVPNETFISAVCDPESARLWIGE